MVKTQKGFTLIELMIVIAIIGILAAVAVPQYGQYTKRAKFADVISATATAKTAISLCYQETNLKEECNDGYAGITHITNTAADVLNTLTVADGTITATGGNPVDGAVYVLDPQIAANGDPIDWTLDEAASSCDDAGVNLCKAN